MKSKTLETRYVSRHKYTQDEQVECWRLDCISDAEFSERQAKEQPERAKELLEYAAECRRQAEYPAESLRAALPKSSYDSTPEQEVNAALKFWSAGIQKHGHKV